MTLPEIIEHYSAEAIRIWEAKYGKKWEGSK